MKQSIRFVVLAVAAVSICWGLYSFMASDAQAQPKKPAAVEGVTFDTAASFDDNLKTYVGKDIIVHLESGKTLQGYVKSVANDLLHLEKLAGRDFYDALIRIDDISILEVKFRDMK